MDTSNNIASAPSLLEQNTSSVRAKNFSNNTDQSDFLSKTSLTSLHGRAFNEPNFLTEEVRNALSSYQIVVRSEKPEALKTLISEAKKTNLNKDELIAFQLVETMKLLEDALKNDFSQFILIYKDFFGSVVESEEVQASGLQNDVCTRLAIDPEQWDVAGILGNADNLHDFLDMLQNIFKDITVSEHGTSKVIDFLKSETLNILNLKAIPDYERNFRSFIDWLMLGLKETLKNSQSSKERYQAWCMLNPLNVELNRVGVPQVQRGPLTEGISLLLAESALKETNAWNDDVYYFWERALDENSIEDIAAFFNKLLDAADGVEIQNKYAYNYQLKKLYSVLKNDVQDKEVLRKGYKCLAINAHDFTERLDACRAFSKLSEDKNLVRDLFSKLIQKAWDTGNNYIFFEALKNMEMLEIQGYTLAYHYYKTAIESNRFIYQEPALKVLNGWDGSRLDKLGARDFLKRYNAIPRPEKEENHPKNNQILNELIEGLISG